MESPGHRGGERRHERDDRRSGRDRRGPSLLDSQAVLVESIVRAVQADLPGEDSPADIADSADTALAEEARRTELTLAYTRLGLLGVVVFLVAASPLREGAPPAPAFTLPLVVVVGVWTLAAVALTVSLAQGWYRRELRWSVPLADGVFLLVAAAFLFGFSPRSAEPSFGVLAAVATTALFLAFSGSSRLSRRGSVIASVMGLLVWGLAVLLSSVGPAPAIFVAAILVVTGVLGTRAARLSRRIITDEVARLRLTHMYEEARQALETREQVLRMVAHDLRNPLSNVKMTAELLMEAPSEHPSRERYLGRIRRQSMTMTRLINDLLDVARIEAGKLHIEPAVVEIDELLDAVAEQMAPLADEAGVRLEIRRDDDRPAVRVDRDRLLQVFSNLVGNAIKFTPEDGTVTVRAARSGSKVRFAVVDTGPGIPREELDQLFGDLWQSRRGDRRGIGLGLSIARAIVEAHGERIGVESELGRGTEFWFTARVARGDV